MGKNYDEAYELLETMAANNYQWPTSRTNQPRVAGIHEVDAITALAAQVATLSKKIDTMAVQSVQKVASVCELCAGDHSSDQCAIIAESVKFVGNYNRQQQQQHNNPNSYNPGWRNHPNLSWKDNQAQNVAPRQQYPPGFQNQAPQHYEKTSNLEELMGKFIERVDTRMNSQDVAIRNLENQMGQLANAINSRPPGTLPSDTEVNPKREGKEHCKAITLRSGKELSENIDKTPKQPLEVESKDDEISSLEEELKKPREEKLVTDSNGGKPSSFVPPIPFPQRLQKSKMDKQFAKFLEVFKKLHINIPFAEALEQMPSYARFMKSILSKKKKLGDFETVALTEECSAILQKKLPPKLKDPGSFSIPCTIGNQFFGRGLCDLGASINLMPLSVYKQLGLKEAKPTNVTLQLADRSITYPRGIVEDVLVKVDKLILPADFLVLDYEEDSNIPIILGRPFLATGRTIIDVQKGELTMRVNDQEVKFHVFKAMKLPDESEECFHVQSVEGKGNGRIQDEESSQLNSVNENVLRSPQIKKKIKRYKKRITRWLTKQFLNRKVDPG